MAEKALKHLREAIDEAEQIVAKDAAGDQPWHTKAWQVDSDYCGRRTCTVLTFERLNANILTIGSTDSILADALAWAWDEFFGIEVKGGQWDPASLTGDGAPDFPAKIYAGRIDHEGQTLLLSLWYGDNEQKTPWVFQDETYTRTQWLSIGILLMAPFLFKSALYLHGPLPTETFTFPTSEDKTWTLYELLRTILRGRRINCHVFVNGAARPWKEALGADSNE